MTRVARGLSIGWILVGDERVASARLQGWRVHGEMVRRGHRSEVLNAPGAFDTRLRWKAPRRFVEAVIRRRQVLVFQKVESSRAARLAALARRVGTKVVFVQADVLESPLYRLAHRVVVSSAELARRLAADCPAPIEVIPDGLEFPREVEAPVRPRREGLRLLFVGNHLNFPAVEPLRRLLAREEFADLELLTVSDHPDADHVWSRERVLEEVQAADVAVIPCEETPATRAKSSNRLTMFMGVGLPVVATPLPSYEEAARSGVEAILARSEGEWAEALRSLRDPARRRSLGEAARRRAWERFAPERIADRWEQVFFDLVGAPAAALAQVGS